MSFNKFEFKDAIDDSQIAYMDCLKVGYDALYTGKSEQQPPTLEEVILASMGKKDFDQAMQKATELAIKQGKPAADISIVDIAQFSQVLTDGDKRRIQELSPKCYDYRIKDIYDTNDLNGFYSCCIDKGDGNISLAFRGSENCKLKSNFYNDWCRGDLALMQNEETIQQKEVYYMLKYYKDIGVLDEAKSINIAGHSLGGNLATHCGILFASDEFDEYLGKVDKVFNLDGPGFSKKYLMKHQEEIKKIGFDENGNRKDIIQHPKWSLIGDLLHDVTYYSDDGEQKAEDAIFIKVDEQKLSNFMDYRHKRKCSATDLIDVLKRQFCRHSTETVTPNVDENNRQDILSWTVIEGEQDALSKVFGTVSRSIDSFVPEILTRSVGCVCTWVAENIFIRPKNEKAPQTLRGIDGQGEGKEVAEAGTYHKVPSDFYESATNRYNYKEPKKDDNSRD